MRKVFLLLSIFLLIVLMSRLNAQISTSDTENSFIEFTKTINKKGIEIPTKFYSILKIDTLQFSLLSPYFSLMKIQQSNENRILGIYNVRDCTPIICLWNIRLYLMFNDQFSTYQNFEIPFQSTPEISFLYEKFLILSDEVVEWEENEAGAMEKVGEPYTNNFIITISNDKIIELSELSLEELRICRNHVFAWYGRKFKSEDLQKHFAQYQWYKPDYDNVDDKLTSTDKEIINTIVSLEKQKNIQP